jgi:hypothetical protein
MENLRARIQELATKGKHIRQDGRLKVEICLGGDMQGPFTRNVNWALLAANDAERHEIFRKILTLWLDIQHEDQQSDRRRQAEVLLGPTLCACCCGRIEPIVATIVATGCQIRIWHGLPCDIGPDSVNGHERPAFSVQHPFRSDDVAHYTTTIRQAMTSRPFIIKRRKKSDREIIFRERLLDNGTSLILAVRLVPVEV